MAKEERKSRAELRAAAAKDIRKALEALGGEGFGLPLAEQPVQALQRCSTGSLALDEAIGGGIPLGRITEIYGPESSGKTSLVMSIMGQAQKAGMTCAFVDAEQTFDREFSRVFGVDPDKVYYASPNNGEQALDAALLYAESGVVDVIAVDSVAALVPQAELDGEMSDQQMGLQARLMSKACRKLAGVLAQNDVGIIFINQLREKIGVMYGSPEVTTGGKALKFYASLRLDVRRKEPIGAADEPIGHLMKVRAVKNKTAPPLRRAEIRLIYASGLDLVGEVVDLAVDQGLVQKGGSWYTLGEFKTQGKESLMAYLHEHPELYEPLLTTVRQHSKL